MSVSTNPPPIPPRRSIGECGSPTHVSSHVTGRCVVHADHFLTVLCTDCVELLCNQCLRIPDQHTTCTLSFLTNDTSLLREQVTSSVKRHTEDLVASMKTLRRVLMKKRERMLKKKRETTSEIERYFNKLRAKINAKLKRDEARLIERLTESVTEQEVYVSDSVNECETILNTMSEKGALLRNQTPSSNDLESIRNFVNVQKEIEAFKTRKRSIEGTRDAFLVIRFFVDSDTEQNMLDSSPACVEVLNSRSNNENQINLESVRINEVSVLQTSAVDSDGGSLDLSVPNDVTHDRSDVDVTYFRASADADDNGSGCVALHQIDDTISSSSGQHSRTPSSSRASSADSSRASTPDNLLSTTSATRSRSATPEVLTNGSSSPDLTLRTSTPNPHNNEGDDALATSGSTDLTTNLENAGASPCSSRATSANSNQSAESNTGGNSDNTINPNNSNNSNNTNNTNNSNNTNNTNDTINPNGTTEPFDEDEPPPPYPGLPTQPGPNELPPPYPGPPPPPYAQNPEPQQPSSTRPRDRLFGESDRALGPMNEVLLSPGRTSAPAYQAEPSVLNVKQLKSFSISELSDHRTSSISALAVFNGRFFLAIDRWNRKLKYFNARGESFGGLLFKEEPWDIAEITTDLFAVTVPKLNSIYKIQGTGNQVIVKSTVITERRYACVAYQRQTEVFVCGQVPQFGEPVIDVIGINGGPVLLTFRTTVQGRELFSYPRYVQVSHDSGCTGTCQCLMTVVVCDWNLKCVVFFKSDGTIVARYKGTPEFPLLEPTGIALNREMNKVFVIDAKRHSTHGVIHRVSMEGVCERVFQRQDDFRDSRAISSYGDRLSVGSKSGIINTYSTNGDHSSRNQHCS